MNIKNLLFYKKILQFLIFFSQLIISYCQLTPTTVLDFLHAQIVSPSVRCTSRLNIFAIRTSSVRKSAWTCAKNKFILINKFGTGNKCMGSPLSKMILNHFFGRVQNARLCVIRTPLHFYKRSRLKQLPLLLIILSLINKRLKSAIISHL